MKHLAYSRGSTNVSLILFSLFSFLFSSLTVERQHG